MSIVPLTKINALDVAFVDLTKMNGTDNVTVLLSLEASVISKLRDKYPGENLNDEINFILDKNTFESNPILEYDGKTKIRSDVLQKLKKISDLMETQTMYPNLKLQQIKKIVKDVLVISDIRTYDKFVKTVNDCIYSCCKKRLSLYESIDCSCFVLVINEKLSEKYH